MYAKLPIILYQNMPFSSVIIFTCSHIFFNSASHLKLSNVLITPSTTSKPRVPLDVLFCSELLNTFIMDNTSLRIVITIIKSHFSIELKIPATPLHNKNKH